MEKKYNIHHCLCTSRWWSNSRDNKIKLDTRKHLALHMLFDNRTPAEQIQRILDISSTALTQEVKSDIIKILSISELDYWFKNWVYKK